MRKQRFTAKAVVLFLILSMIAPAAYAHDISDIKGHWAESQIEQMIGDEIISGYPDGSFRPEGEITRAEFASLVVRGFKLTGTGVRTFEDTKDHWAKGFISIANAYGIVSGYSETSFGPDDPITREQMAVIVVKASNATKEADEKVFLDSSSISEWAREAVAIATSNQLINGYPDNTFRPKGNTTRAEAAVVLTKGIALSSEEEPEEFDYSNIEKAGTYGPKTGTENVSGDVVVKAKGTILQNLVIKGDLIIAKEVGGGDVTLNNIKVSGKVYIRGGGKDSIHINGGEYEEIVIERTVDGAIRIVAFNSEKVPITISTKAEGDEIILEGDISTVTIKADNIKIVTKGATTIGKIEVARGLKDVEIELSRNSTVEEAILNSEVNVTGKGIIEKADGAKAEDSTFETEPKEFVGESTQGGGGSSTSKNVSAISVEGVPVVGYELNATDLKPTGASGKVTYQWQSITEENGKYEAITDATDETYTIKEGDLSVRVKVTAKSGTNYRGSAYSDPVEIVDYFVTPKTNSTIKVDETITVYAPGADDLRVMLWAGGLDSVAEAKTAYDDKVFSARLGDIIEAADGIEGNVDADDGKFSLTINEAVIDLLEAGTRFGPGDAVESGKYGWQSGDKTTWIITPVMVEGDTNIPWEDYNTWKGSKVDETFFVYTLGEPAEATLEGFFKTINENTVPVQTFVTVQDEFYQANQVQAKLSGFANMPKGDAVYRDFIEVEADGFTLEKDHFKYTEDNGENWHSFDEEDDIKGDRAYWGPAEGTELDLSSLEDPVFAPKENNFSVNLPVGVYTLKVGIAKVVGNGYEDVFVTNEVEMRVEPFVSELKQGYYAAGDEISFEISRFSPGEIVRVGMPILIHDGSHAERPFMDWACDEEVLMSNMYGDDDERYWEGITDNDGVLTVEGKVGPDLSNGQLCITLPDYGYSIDNAIRLGVRVGDSD